MARRQGPLYVPPGPDYPGFEGAARGATSITSALLPDILRQQQDYAQAQAELVRQLAPVPAALGGYVSGITGEKFKPATLGEYEAGLPLVQGQQAGGYRVNVAGLRAGAAGGGTPFNFKAWQTATRMAQADINAITPALMEQVGTIEELMQKQAELMPLYQTRYYAQALAAAGQEPTEQTIGGVLGGEGFSPTTLGARGPAVAPRGQGKPPAPPKKGEKPGGKPPARAPVMY